MKEWLFEQGIATRMRLVFATVLTLTIVLSKPAIAADVSGFAVAGVKLGMPLDAANAILEKRAVPFNAPGVRGIASRGLKYTFYNCRSGFSYGGLTQPEVHALNDLTPESVPDGVCVDAGEATTATGRLSITFLPTVAGDARSQVVARVHLVDRIPPERRVAHEAIAVHYYESQAVARYGAPTYRDPYRAHRDVATTSEPQAMIGLSGIAFPVASVFAGLCNATGCTEHQGGLIWCSGSVSPAVCSQPSIIPEDSKPVDFHYREPHVATEPGPAPTFDYHANHTQAQLEAYQKELRRHDAGTTANRLADIEDERPYALLGRPSVGQRLLLRFNVDEDAADVVLENEALFAERFPVASPTPHAVATPAF